MSSASEHKRKKRIALLMIPKRMRGKIPAFQSFRWFVSRNARIMKEASRMK